MPLDPQARDVLSTFGDAPPPDRLTVAEVRRAAAARSDVKGPPEPLETVGDITIPGPDRAMGARLYEPTERPPGVVVYLHGGGWVLGDLDIQDGLCRSLANASGCTFVSVDYRLAPEFPYPAALEDVYAAIRWVDAHAADFGVRQGMLAVAGDSAGGNLAAAAAIMARDRGAPALRFQLLMCPITDYEFDSPSMIENGEGYFLTRDRMRWYWSHYLAEEASADDPYASPLRATDVSELPPAHVVTAEYDPLRDQGDRYAERLRGAGVDVTHRCHPGMIHGFMGMAGAIDRAGEAVAEAADALRRAFTETG